MFFFDDDGQLRSLPSGWTDADPADPFDVVSAGRAAFRVQDLVALADLIEAAHPPAGKRSVRRTTPPM